MTKMTPTDYCMLDCYGLIGLWEGLWGTAAAAAQQQSALQLLHLDQHVCHPCHHHTTMRCCPKMLLKQMWRECGQPYRWLRLLGSSALAWCRHAAGR